MQTRGFSTLNNVQLIECNVVGGSVGAYLDGAACRVERCKIGQAGIGISSGAGNAILDNTLNAPPGGGGQGILLVGDHNHVEHNEIAAYGVGIQVTSRFNLVISNGIQGGGSAITVTGTPNNLVAPVVTNAAALTVNPIANTQQ